MKRLKKLTAVLVAATMMLCCAVSDPIDVRAEENPAELEDTATEFEDIEQKTVAQSAMGFLYEIKDETHIGITGYEGEETSVVIPETIDGYTVSAIEAKAFEKKGITNIELPETVSEIGSCAFSNCDLLEEVKLPNSIEKMGYQAFAGCDLLSSINYPTAWAECPVSDYIYTGCVFKDCPKLTEIVVPDGVTRIPSSAFSDMASLQKVVFPDSLTSIGGSAFKFCTGLTSFTLPETISKVEERTFEGCKNLKEIIFPENLDAIGEFAFRECDSLEEVKIPDSVTQMGYKIFEGCDLLRSVNYPRSWTECTVYDYIFYGCIFKDCPNLTEIEVPDGITRIPDYAFSDSASLTNIILPESVTSIGVGAFHFCTGLTTYTLPSKVTEIKEMTFEGCTGLKEIALPENLDTIGSFAFRNCDSLEKVQLPDSVSKIGFKAFEDCDLLYSINYPRSWTECTVYDYIRYGCIFENCPLLTEIEIPDGITRIPAHAFCNMGSLRSISLPDSVEAIGDRAFASCENLRSISVSEHVMTIGSNVFEKCPNVVVYCPYYSVMTLYAIKNGLSFLVSDDGLRKSETALVKSAETYYSMETVNSGDQGLLKFTLRYTLKDEEKEYSDKKLVFFLPRNCELKEETIKQDGETCRSFEQKDGFLLIPVEKAEGDLAFSVCISEGDAIRSYAQLQYGAGETEILGIINESVPIVSLQCDERISANHVKVNGVAPKQSTVSLYVDGQKVKEVVASKAGNYKADFSLDHYENGRTYRLRAECVDGGEVKGANATIKCDESSPELSELKMYHNSATGFDLLNSENIPYVTYKPRSPFTFTVDFENKDKVESVYVVSTRNNTKKTMEAKYDDTKGMWVASGYFDEDNKKYVPGAISVDYTTKHEKTTITSEVDESMFVGEKTTLPKSCYQNYQVTSSGGVSCDVDLTDSGIEFDAGGKTGKIVYNTVMDAVFLTSGDKTLNYLRKGGNYTYDLLDTDGETWRVLCTEDGPRSKSIYCAKLRDLIGIEQNGVEVYKLCVTSDLPLDEISKGLGVAGLSLDAIGKSFGYQADYEDLVDEIMSNSNIKNKEEALRKAEDLRNVEIVWTLASTAVKGLVIYGLALTGPAAIAFTAAMAVVDLIAELLFKEQLAEILGKQFSLNWIIDPSGYVYEGVTDNRISGVTATVYYKEKMEDPEPLLWEASEYNQNNPLITDLDGAYAWDVPEGFWQVKFEKSGYLAAYSDWLQVPPPQTDVNIGMYPDREFMVLKTEAHDKYIRIIWNQYCKTSGMDGIVITNNKGDSVSYKVVPEDEGTDSDGTTYAKEYRLVFKNTVLAEGERVSVNIPATIETGNGRFSTASQQQAVCESEMKLNIRDSVWMDMGEKVSIPVEVENYDGKASYTAVIDAPDFVSIRQEIALDESGKGELVLFGELYGQATVRILRDEVEEKSISVFVTQEKEPEKKSVEALEIETPDRLTYTGKEQTPKITVKDGSTVLVEGTDYTVSYNNNKNAGKANATVHGIGMYEGEAEVGFLIDKKEITVSRLEFHDKYYNGSKYMTLKSQYPKTKGILEGDDVRVKTSRPDYVITGTKSPGEKRRRLTVGLFTLTGKDAKNYKIAQGTTACGTIKKVPLKKVVLKSNKAAYNGKPQKPVISKIAGPDGMKILQNNSVITYKRNGKETKDFTSRGTIEVLVTGEGNYKGSSSAYYTIY